MLEVQDRAGGGSFCREVARHMMFANVHFNGAGLGPFRFAAMALAVLETKSLEEVHGFVVLDRQGHEVATCAVEGQAQFLVNHLNARRTSDATIYFCDRHRHELLSEQLQDGEAGVELGAYCPNTDCDACDPWR